MRIEFLHLIEYILVMKRARKVFLVIFCTILVLFGASLAYHFTRPEINVVLSDAEALLYEGAFPSGLFSPCRVAETVYPEVKEGGYRLYSPLAAVMASADGADVEGYACFGLERDNEEFALRFIPDETRRWENAYQETGTTLLSAVIYDETGESGLASQAPADFMRFAYAEQLSRVGAEELAARLREAGVSHLVIYSPWDAVELFEYDEGYTFTLPVLFKNVMEENVKASYVSEDFEAMFSAVVNGETGEKETPYILVRDKNRVEVLLDKLF